MSTKPDTVVDPSGAGTRASGEWAVRDPALLGEIIAHHRRGAGLTQADLAEQAGVHRSYLSAIEGGRTTTHADVVFRLIRRLGLEVIVRPGPGAT